MDDKITINNEVYVRENSLKQELVAKEGVYNNFDNKEYKHYYNKLNSFLGLAKNPLHQNKAWSREKLEVLDAANVLSVRGKSLRAKDLLRLFIEDPEGNLELKTKETEGSVWIGVKKEYPLIVSDDDWELILAPRVDNE
jgi:hypothetical protein